MNTLGAIFALIGMFHCYDLLNRLMEADLVEKVDE